MNHQHGAAFGLTQQNNLIAFDEIGFEDANDTSTASTPINLTPDTWTALPNDGLGSFSNKSYLPGGITRLFNPSTGKIDPTELELGSYLLVRADWTVNPTINGAFVEYRLTLGNGGNAYALPVFSTSLANGGGKDYRFTPLSYVYMGDTNTRNNEIGLEVKCSELATLTVAGMAIQAARRVML